MFLNNFGIHKLDTYLYNVYKSEMYQFNSPVRDHNLIVKTCRDFSQET